MPGQGMLGPTRQAAGDPTKPVGVPAVFRITKISKVPVAYPFRILVKKLVFTKYLSSSTLVSSVLFPRD
jgi:hypothetical protein